jgi:hypothetical protein
MSSFNPNAPSLPSDRDSFTAWARWVTGQVANLQANRGITSVRIGDLADVALVPALASGQTPVSNARYLAWNRTLGLWVPTDPPDILWSAPSPPTVSVSDGVTPKNTIGITGFSMTIPTAASAGSTTAKLWKNGTSGTLIATVTIASGAHYGYATSGGSSVGSSWASPGTVTITGRTDYYQVQFTAVGTGADLIGGGIELG